MELISNTVKVHKHGRMVLSTMEIGEAEWQKEKVFFIMLMEMYIQESSTKIEPTVLEYMFTLMVKSMRDSGKMICKMVQGKKN